ncbi:COG2426 family protein [Haloimpatiens sp. FM7330]|uniref:COG2426 family protein n=1 Tax=Haloimpatiens sp. FM7330 TaxID=3298610 RepID=UPI00362554AE
MDLLKVLFWSAVPIVEQRGAIPAGIIIYNLDPITVFIISLIGSLLPVPFILLLFNKIFSWMKRYKIFAGINRFIENKINKNSTKMEKYKEIGLIAFIAIPLPTTGIWTGSAVAAFLNLDTKKSLLCAAIGGIISAIVITILSLTIPSLLGY